MDLNAAALFVKVIQYGSFSETARRTKIPVATVSRRIKQLEEDLGFRLLERSTRYLRVTDAGASFLEHAAQGVEAFEAGRSTLEQYQAVLSGTLRLSVPSNFLPWRDLLQRFQAIHPNVGIKLLATERKVDLIEEGIDVALRIGDRKDKQAVSKLLGTYRHVLVASPKLLKGCPSLEHPSHLDSIPCATWNNFTGSTVWRLGEETVEIHPFIQVNDYLHLRELALSGVCATELPPFLVKKHIDSGQLTPILQGYPFPGYELNLLYPSGKHLSRLVRTYIAFCVEWATDLFKLTMFNGVST
ncbi:MAG: LysR substrate-binding domain-containing protein [Cyanobacteria bacterium P01_D01_bin.1]